MKSKKYLALILSLVMCLSLCPLNIAAADTDVTFTAIDGSGNSSANEVYPKLIDGSTSTKWGSSFKSGDKLYIVIKASTAVVLTGYSFTTANDNASNTGRNPKDWTISGCNNYDSQTDGWQEICSVKNDSVLQDKNYTKYDFTVDNTKMYQYYKLEITATKGATFMQLSEMGFTYHICEHDWEKIETPASCTEPAYIISTCKVCGMEETTQTTPALGHLSDGSNICARCNQPLQVKVDDKYYGDIQTAVDESAENATITLLGDVNITSTINIKKTLALDLNSFTVTQTAEQGIIGINNGKTFTLTDSSDAKTGTITGGKSSSGGGVYVGANCTFYMTGITISDCRATDSLSEGAGIFSSGTTVITDSKITNCSAQSGGGIFTNGGKLTVNNSIIENCSVTDWGGGIYVYNGADVTIENNTVIRKNLSSRYGGGIHVIHLGKSSVVTINDSSVTENESTLYGGGIGLGTGSTLTLNNAKITGNTAVQYAGGGIYALNSTINVTNGSKISENTAQSDGGAIYAEGGTVDINTDSTIYKNTATKGSGGGVYATGASITTEQCNISENTAYGNGGGIYVIRSTATLNSASAINSNKSLYGAGVYIHASDLTANNIKINGNIANRFGGGLLVQIDGRASTATLTDSEINENTSKSTDNGGAGIWINGNDQYKTTVTLNNCSVKDNHALNGGYGGGIHLNKSALNINSGSITGNTTTSAGGGIYNNGTLTVSAAPQIYQNLLLPTQEGKDESLNNIYLPTGKTIEIGEGGLYYDEATYTPPLLSVTAQDASAAITGKCADYTKEFLSDDPNRIVIYSDGVMKLAEACMIYFDYNTGYIHPQRVQKNVPYAEPEDLYSHKEGYIFAGWFIGEKGYDFTKPVTSDITLTAKWVKEDETVLSITPNKFYIFNPLPGADVFIASYGENGLIDVKRISNVKEDMTSALPDMNTVGATRYSIFMWNGMQPVCADASTGL